MFTTADLISKQSVVDGTESYLAGNVSTPYEFWYNYMSLEQYDDFAGSAQLFADTVYKRVEMLTGANPYTFGNKVQS